MLGTQVVKSDNASPFLLQTNKGLIWMILETADSLEASWIALKFYSTCQFPRQLRITVPVGDSPT